MKVLVLGGATSWADDARAALRLFVPDRVYAANHVGILWPGRLHAWCTMHPDEMWQWRNERAALDRNSDYEAVTYLCADRKRGEHIDRYHEHMWPGQRNSGSSGLFATKVALDDGATHVVLAGIPIDAQGSHIVRPGAWKDAVKYQETWAGIAHRFGGRVRSMSGWTARELGTPTTEWLAASPAPTTDVVGRTGPEGP